MGHPVTVGCPLGLPFAFLLSALAFLAFLAVPWHTSRGARQSSSSASVQQEGHRPTGDPSHENPNDGAAYWQTPGLKTRPANGLTVAEASRAGRGDPSNVPEDVRRGQFRAQTKNPTRRSPKGVGADSFWQSRGYTSRPRNWMDFVRAAPEQGQFEHVVNAFVAKPQRLRKAIAQDARRAEGAARQALGSQTLVRIVGGQAERADIEGSDLDLRVEPQGPVDDSDRARFVRALEREFGEGTVDNGSSPRTIKVLGDAGPVEVIWPNASPEGIGSKPFEDGPVAREAVEGIKTWADVYGMDIKGDAIERAVLQVQESNPGIDLEDLAEKAAKQLLKPEDGPVAREAAEGIKMWAGVYGMDIKGDAIERAVLQVQESNPGIDLEDLAEKAVVQLLKQVGA